MKKLIVFTIAGDTGADRAEALQVAYDEWQKNPQDSMPVIGTGSITMQVRVTGPTHDTSVEHAVSYAVSELKDGIGEAGGSIWDGTHVQLTVVGRREKRS